MADKPLNIALVCDEIIGDYMAAGGIRFWRIARHLRESGHAVQLFARSDEDSYDGFAISPARSFGKTKDRFDIAVAGTLTREGLPGLLSFPGKIIHDLICPFMLENRHLHQSLPEMKKRAWEEEFARDFLSLAWKANAYLVASDAQRAYWTGYLVAAGVWHGNYSDPPPVVVFPNGVDEPETSADSELPADVIELLARLDAEPDKRWMVTNGGLYRWMDVETILRAFAQLRADGRNIGLVLLGAAQPGERGAGLPADAALKLAEELGVSRDIVIHGWLPHLFRQRVLKRAALGINVHAAGLETELSYRNRLLDFAAAETPVVTSTGGVVSDRLIETGIAMPYAGGGPELLAWVAGRALDATWGASFRQACEAFRAEWGWKALLPAVNDAVALALDTPSPADALVGPRPGGLFERFYSYSRYLFRRYFTG